MKKILIGVISILIIVLVVILIRTNNFESKQIFIEPVSHIKLNREILFQNLSRAIQFETVSNQDSEQTNISEFINFNKFINAQFPLIFKNCTVEFVNEFSILIKWQSKDNSILPVLLMAHYDVVPVESESNWDQPAFIGFDDSQYIWGRGTLDDKSNVMSILEAVENLIETGFQPNRTIYLSFGHDEEVGGNHGAKTVAEKLASEHIQFEFVLDEGLAIIDGMLPGITNPVALIGIAEKGYATLELSAYSSSGHSSMPPNHTAIGFLSQAINQLEANPMPIKISPVIKKFFDYIGPEMPFVQQTVFANQWIFKPILISIFEKNPATNALLKTTTAVTMISGGIKENVLPNSASAIVNFRILPGNTVDDVIKHVNTVIQNDQIQIQTLTGTLNGNPSKISATDSDAFKILHSTIKQIFPEVIVAPSLVIGGTDSRHFENIADNIYRFMPLRLNKTDLDRIHGENERIEKENYVEMIQFYRQLIINL